ncbi:MAG: S1 RNA-binding domain-containing protein [Erysipelotrichaceae bacterium]|nr:S1 RNA-binding domain-containing protein [Erysipelotrichaceae bacterium]
MPRKKITEDDSKPIINRVSKKKTEDKEDVKTEKKEPEKAEKATKKESVAEVVVPADAEEPKAGENKKSAAKKKAKTKTVAANEPIIKRSPKKTISQDVPGIKSDEIRQTEAKEIPSLDTNDEKEIATLEDLKDFMNRKQILWGEVYGVDDGVGPLAGHVIMSVMYNGIRVQIPDQVFFESNYNLGSDYNSLPEFAPEGKPCKYKRRKDRGQYYNGARVCFVIKAVSRDIIEEGYFEGEYEPNVFASRTEAMEQLRNIYFGKNSEYKIEVDAITTANIMTVRPDRVRVECLGVESSIDTYNLSDEPVENCEDIVQTGDKIKVRIRKIYSDDNYIAVTGRLKDVNKMINSMMIGSSYLGYVDKFNPKDSTYKITLKNGVQASVKQELVRGREKLIKGDRVSVRVTEIKPSFVIGLALKY